jgi:hypothetical protein
MIFFLLSTSALPGFPFACIDVCSFAFALFERPNPARATMLLNDRIVSRLYRAAIRNFSLILQSRKHAKLRPHPVRIFRTNSRKPRLTVGFLGLDRPFNFEHATKLMTGAEFAAQSSKTANMVLNYINRHAKQGIKKSGIALAERKLAIHARDHAPKQCPDKTKMDPEAGELSRAAVPALPAEQQKHRA